MSEISATTNVIASLFRNTMTLNFAVLVAVLPKLLIGAFKPDTAYTIGEMYIVFVIVYFITLYHG